MGFSFSTLDELFTHQFDDVIDVRSPSEFAEDHLPGAINLPVLDDDERTQVGTMYVQDCPFKARKLGAALVSANASRHLLGPLANKDGRWKPLIYCWRGGQRSGSFGSILSQIGWRVEVLEGGYRSYRRLVVSQLHDTTFEGRVVLLDGNTGTAKTDILKACSKLGLQTLDLEGLARHRGSIFGARSGSQPSQKQFESEVARELAKFDLKRPIVIEAESSKVGERLVPPALWRAMCEAPRIRIEAPVSARADYLVRTYPELVEDTAELKRLIAKLSPFYAKERLADWFQHVDERRFADLAEALIGCHYDPRYRKSGHTYVQSITLDALDGGAISAAAKMVHSAVDLLD